MMLGQLTSEELSFYSQVSNFTCDDVNTSLAFGSNICDVVVSVHKSLYLANGVNFGNLPNNHVIQIYNICAHRMTIENNSTVKHLSIECSETKFIRSPMIYQNKHLISVTARFSNLSMVGNLFFNDCVSLRKINLSVPALRAICTGWFKGCKSLTVITLDCPALEIVGMSWFEECRTLRQISLNLPRLEYVGLNWFAGCLDLCDIDINCPSLISVGSGWFSRCKTIECITISCPKLRILGENVFADCHELNQVYLKCQDLRIVKGSMFKRCKRLTQIVLKCPPVIEWFTEFKHMTIVDCTFGPIPENCWNASISNNCAFKQVGPKTLMYIDGQITIIRTWFNYCNTLEYARIVCPDIISIESWFSRCEKLKTVDLICPQLESVGHLWLYNCKNLINVLLNCPMLCTIGSCWLDTCESLLFLNLKLPSLYSVVSGISRCPNLTDLHLELPSLRHVEMCMFHQCDKIKHLALNCPRFATIEDLRTLSKKTLNLVYSSPRTNDALVRFRRKTFFDFICG